MIAFASSALCNLITDRDRAIQKPCSGIQGENEADKDAGESGAGKEEEDREGSAFCSCCLGLKGPEQVQKSWQNEFWHPQKQDTFVAR